MEEDRTEIRVFWGTQFEDGKPRCLGAKAGVSGWFVETDIAVEGPYASRMQALYEACAAEEVCVLRREDRLLRSISER